MIRLTICLLGLDLAFGGCNKPAQTQAVSDSKKEQNAAQASRSPVRPSIEACSLITKEEVGAIQNTAISDAKSSETSDGSHLITQCYYASTGPNLSVSLSLTQPGSGTASGSSPRDFWQQTFGPYRNTEKKEDKEREEAEDKQKSTSGRRGEEGEEKKTPPKKIDGVGEEAFWAGSRFGGALYVLQKDYILRISVGGPNDQETKISKSKALAQKALDRL